MIANRKFLTGNKVWRTAGGLAIGLVCFASVNAGAQVSITTTNDGAMTSTTAPIASTVIPDAHPKVEEPLAAGANVIYSNFGTGASLYDASTGWTEAGVAANDEAIAEAMPFTPASNFILVRIDAAFTYVTGSNGTKLVLAEDNGGVPGKIIYSATFTNLPVFGTCCTVQTVTLSPTKSSHIPLKGGQTYWLYPLPLDTTGYLVWNLDTTGQGGTGALSHDYGKTWIPAALATFGAFDLYGLNLGQ